jgi:hypothetical protein
MKAAWLAVLLCTVALEGTLAAPLDLAPGSWEFTTLLRNFSISADGEHEVDNGYSEPNTERACVTEDALKRGFLYRGLKNPTVAKYCKVTTISETLRFIDSVDECLYEGGPSYIGHTVLTAPTPMSFVAIRETTFLEPNYDGSISRSTIYRRGRWLKESCEKRNGHQTAPNPN